MKGHQRLARRIALGIVLLAVLATSACGNRGGTVSGVVTYQSKPLSIGTVLFVGDDKNPVRAPINNDGSYQVDNVPAGNAKIAVLVPPPTLSAPNNDPSPASATAANIPPKYMDAEISGLSYTVTPGSQQHNIDLK